jgi:uncharacterized membrane protein (DUF485 family)
MNQDAALRIAAQPAYQALRSRRARFGAWLTAAMLAVYYGFILLVAFDKPLLATRLGEGVMTLGIPLGLGVIVFTIAITALYVRRANQEFDALAKRIEVGATR